MGVLLYKTLWIVSNSPVDCGSVRPFLTFTFSALCAGGMGAFSFFFCCCLFFLPGLEQCFNSFDPKAGQNKVMRSGLRV